MASDKQPGTEVATFDPTSSAFPVLFAEPGEGLAEIIEDNFGDEGFSPVDLDRVTVPAGGGTSWEIPDEEPTRTIEGVIVHKQPGRAMWWKARGEGGEEDGPPDCYSPDGKIGVGAMGPGSEGNPSGQCAVCPLNQFESSTRGSGKGKACKESMALFMLQEGSVLPIQVSLPPTSLRGWRKYMTRLAGKGKSYYAVVTRLALAKTSANGQTFSVVEPSRVQEHELAPAEAAAAKAYGQTIKQYLDEAAAIREADAAASAGAGTVSGSVGGDPDNATVWTSGDADAGTPEGQDASPQEPATAKS